MARRFVRASSSVLDLTNTDDNLSLDLGPCTIAAVIYKNTDGLSQAVLSGVTPSGGQLEFYIGSTDRIGIWNNPDTAGTDSGAGMTVTTSDGWTLVAMTKAAGSAAPTFYKATVGAALASATGASLADSSQSAISWRVGAYAAGDESSDHDFAAVAYWTRVMSSGEIDGLRWGDWARHEPVLLAEFPGGVDDPGGSYRSIDRYRETQTAIGGNQRSARPDPPGFRYSSENWRAG